MSKSGEKGKTEMSYVKLNTSDPGAAADVIGRAMILFARTSGYAAANQIRESSGYALMYADDSFEAAIDECFPELREQAVRS